MLTKCGLPVDCVLAVTYNCNARCEMCDIWRIRNSPELPIEAFVKLPASLRDINLSGGEPFLRADLPEIVRVLQKACPQARMVISSNGFATALIEKQMKAILAIKPNIGVAISIDGLGALHDEIRGVPGGFDQAIMTIKSLQGLGMSNLRLAFTLLDKNVNHLSKVYDLSRQLGIQFTHSYAQSSDFYFGGKQNDNKPRAEVIKREYDYIIKQELRGWNWKRWARAYFTRGMHEFIVNQQPVLSSSPGRDFFFLDPNGNIYPSVVHNVILGNIKELKQSFEQFWCSKELEDKRQEVDALKLPVWMICTARTAMKHHPLGVGWWVLKNKFVNWSVGT